MRFHAYIKPDRKDGRLLFIVTRDGDQVHRDYIDHNSKWERDKLIEGASRNGLVDREDQDYYNPVVGIDIDYHKLIVDAALAAIESGDKGDVEGAPAAPAICSPVIVRLSDVQPEPVRWLWQGRLARGKMSLLSGDPGLGKSMITMDLTARVTRGFAWPDQPSVYAPKGSVVILNAEDDLADTIRPRLDAAGADVSKVVSLQAVRTFDEHVHEHDFNLEHDLPALEQAIAQLGDCVLAVIDPVTAYLGRTDSHKNAEVRGLLKPLGTLASKYDVAIVLVSHLTKGSGPAIYRTLGSLAFVAAVRSAWAITKDKQDPRRRLFLPVKNNIAADTTGMAYSIVDGVVAWERDPVDVSVDEALAPEADEAKHTERQDAKAWLREALADGPLPAKEVQKLARENGHAASTLRRAAKELKVQKRRHGFGQGAVWNWGLPTIDDHDPTIDDIDVHSHGVSTYDTYDINGEHLCNAEPQDEWGFRAP